MIFGPVPLAQALGAVLAHSVQAGETKLRKGRVLGAADIAILAAGGIAQVVVARMDPGDIGEDAAADALARAIVPDEAQAGLTRTVAHTGRVNLNAVGPGVAVVDAAAVNALNRVDPAITLATVGQYQRVSKGTLVGTVKIISYGVEGGALQQALGVACGALRIQPVQMKTAGLVMTSVPGQDQKLNVKGREAMAKRLRALGVTLADVRDVAHQPDAVAQALADLGGEIILILTGSATSDLYDTGPQAVRLAGGSVERFGMPVDPGNLLFLGDLAGRPVIGLPGCARSVALNGADWVLERLVCGIRVTGEDIARMGVGGLLKEIPIRPQPREG